MAFDRTYLCVFREGNIACVTTAFSERVGSGFSTRTFTMTPRIDRDKKTLTLDGQKIPRKSRRTP